MSFFKPETKYIHDLDVTTATVGHPERLFAELLKNAEMLSEIPVGIKDDEPVGLA